MNATIKAEQRDAAASRGDLRRIREAGKVPGVVYGAGMAKPTPIAVDEKQLIALLRSHPHALMEMEVPGIGSQPVMMTDVQRDAVSRRLLHIDFQQVDMNVKIRAPSRLETEGKSPGEHEGGMLQLVLHELEVECLPNDYPETIKIDISGLELGDHLCVGDLKLPPGVAAMHEAEDVVVAILAPQKERTPEELEEMSDAAEENRKHHEQAIAAEKD